MTEKNGILTFESDKDSTGLEMDNYSQRNNELVFPNPKKYPKAQYTSSWKNMCNVTSMVMGLSYSGWIFPSGIYKQPEDNLGYFILTDKNVLDYYAKTVPSYYNCWQRSLTGKCTEAEVKKELIYPPTELHDTLSYGARQWLDAPATKFSTNVNFLEALWNNMVKDNLPIVISTTFGGFGHIVCCTGVQYKKEDYLAISKDFSQIKARDPETGKLLHAPYAIIVDDPWGKYNPNTNKYDAPNSGNDIVVPWDVVVNRVKPAGSDNNKWAHTFAHAPALV